MTKAKSVSWDVAQTAVNVLPPYLGADELTAERLYEKNKDKLSSIEDARTVLKELVNAGKMYTEDRRSGKGGSRIKVYIAI